MRYIILIIFTIIVVLMVLASMGCVNHAGLKYSCEGKCSGELSRDVDISSPEQYKALKEPK